MSKQNYFVFMPKTLVQLENFLHQLLRNNKENIIIKILSENINTDDLLSLFNKYEEQIKIYKRNKSIVFLTDNISYEQVPDYVSIAPTEEEALDIIDFEEIERDLFLED